MYLARNRWNSPPLGRWIERDPLEYIDGMGLNEYVRGGAVSATDPSGLSASDAVGRLIDMFQLYIGTEANFQCCTPSPIPGALFCIVVTVSIDEQSCCKDWHRTVCTIVQLNVSGGLYAAGSVLPGCTFSPTGSSWKKPARKPGQWPPSNVPIRHGLSVDCPPQGLSGHICITGSVGVRSWTAGARGCMDWPGGHFTVEAGMGIGYGTGLAVEGGASYTNCHGPSLNPVWSGPCRTCAPTRP